MASLPLSLTPRRPSRWISLTGAIVAITCTRALAQEDGDFDLEPFTLTLPGGEEVECEHGTLWVPEVRDDPDSRLIGVGFLRILATEQPPTSPPVFWLPGGPGTSLIERARNSDGSMMPQRMAAYCQFRDVTDVVLVDQRGYSAAGDQLMIQLSQPARDPMRAPSDDETMEAFRATTEIGVAQFADTEVDLRGYTVMECAADVEALSGSLAYDEITLVGTSFGSQWSFAVMRLFPEIVARAMLSGVEPLDHGYDMPGHIWAAIRRMWTVVEEDPAFADYLPEGGMQAASLDVIRKLEAGLPIERNGTRIATLGPGDFPWRNADQILELFHGQVDRWVGSSYSAGSVQRPIIAPLIDSSLHTTPERLHQLWTDPATRYLGRENFSRYVGSRDLWPSEDVGDDFRRPILCDIPVVFAQGDWDTSTPVENTYEIAPYFPNGRVLVAERGGHGVFGPIDREHPAVWDQLAEFVRTGDQEGIPARVRLSGQPMSPPRFAVTGVRSTEDTGR